MCPLLHRSGFVLQRQTLLLVGMVSDLLGVMLLAHKLCWAFLYAGVLIAQTPPVTPNIGLYLPAHGTYNWDTYYNTNWSSLDTRLGSVRSILDFGAKGDGTVADNATAFQAASTWAN